MIKYQRKNFAGGSLNTDLAQAASSMTMAAGHTLPTTTDPFMVVIWNSSAYSTPSNDPNAEFIKCIYSGSVNIYNLTRAQESTSDVAHASSTAKVSMTYSAGVSENDFYFIGTKEVDETTIGNTKILQYKSSSGKLEYVGVPGGGDMLMSVYDTDEDGVLNVGAIPTGAGIPMGCILLWYGSVATVPAGWHICDGTSGTPDLRNRFVIGAGNTYAVDASGGSTTIAEANLPAHSHASGTLTAASSGAHTHNVTGMGSGGGISTGYMASASSSTNPYNLTAASDGTHTHTTSGSTATTGSGTAYLQPYYALCYIMKL